MRPRFEMAKQNARGASDVDHLELAALGRGLGGPGVDIVPERVVARLAQAVIFGPSRIDAIGVVGFGKFDGQGKPDLGMRHAVVPAARERAPPRASDPIPRRADYGRALHAYRTRRSSTSAIAVRSRKPPKSDRALAPRRVRAQIRQSPAQPRDWTHGPTRFSLWRRRSGGRHDPRSARRGRRLPALRLGSVAAD